jgi:molybdopterin/thiamine biosynthesis adenylyltransferase
MDTTSSPSSYDLLVLRNIEYIAPEVQEKIRNTTLLIAGCGMGSYFAICAARMGFTKFILADGDTVSAHNLNRQCYVTEDIGVNKATALTRHIQAINPEAEIETVSENLSGENLPDIVSHADFVFDTVDFLALEAITALHDQCEAQQKPRITAFNVGFDGGIIYFPKGSPVTFRKVFGLPLEGSVAHLSYIESFGRVVKRMSQDIDPSVIKAVSKALTVMEDGSPCPASQVAPGSFGTANLAGTMLYRILAGLPVTPAPDFIVGTAHTLLSSPGINMLER